MGKNADHVRELREQAQRRIQIRDGGAGLHATPNGRAAKVTSVKDVRVDEKGNLIVTKRDDFIGEGGNVAGIGGAVEQNIGKVGTKEKAKVQRIVEGQEVNAPEEEEEQLEGDGKSIVVDDKTIKVKGFDDADENEVPVKIGDGISWKLPMNVKGNECYSVNFESESDSNVTFNVTVSGGVATVKVGVYWK